MSERTGLWRGFWWRHALLPGLLFGACMALVYGVDLDLRVASWFYDSQRGVWRWGDSVWTNQILHTGGRDLIVLIALVALALWLASGFVGSLARLRRPLGGLVLTMLLGTSAVWAGKQLTNIDCPRSLERYGGSYPYVGLFQHRPDGLRRAKCFPGGHSSGGFSLFGLYFFLRALGSKRAWTGLLAGGLVGSVFAFGQWARGAHFPSHDLWSAILCWYIALGVYQLLWRGPARVKNIRVEGADAAMNRVQTGTYSRAPDG